MERIQIYIVGEKNMKKGFKIALLCNIVMIIFCLCSDILFYLMFPEKFNALIVVATTGCVILGMGISSLAVTYIILKKKVNLK